MIKCRTVILLGFLVWSSSIFVLRGLEEFSVLNVFYTIFGLALYSVLIYFVYEISRYHPPNDPIAL